ELLFPFVTTILFFMVGGCFAGFDLMIKPRWGNVGVGFGADIRSEEQRDHGEMFSQVRPEDLNKFGLIPEFIGRLPVIGVVSNLERDMLVRILVEPKNALVRQYCKFFEFENVELVITDDALDEVANLALSRNTGARGLRAILEEVLLDVMYELPGKEDVVKCVVTAEAVRGGESPQLLNAAKASSVNRTRRQAS
ncbi:MAG: ATP-dependent Clp protease ATP-binding subunit ClpX, partial [Acidimicrobiia bacterium]|nr:ATP-dependent Clp protease ATP-binding subunit ClpX [Acidimicrobiia bacterium]